MKVRSLFIAALILFSSLSSSLALAQEGDAAIELKPSAASAAANTEFSVDVLLKNPGRQKVISVRAWLEYDAQALEGLSIGTDNTPFTLAAPGENEFAPAENHVKIGRSNISGGATDAEIKIATLRFKVKTTQPVTTSIRPYDYQVTELGHVSVNILEQGFPVNILGNSPEAIQIALNGGGSGSSGAVPVGVPPASGGIGGPDTSVPVPVSPLIRPSNVRINTGKGAVDLQWDTVPDPARMGYNVYYGKTSGQYTRRRTVENVSRVHLDGLNNNEAYYFAVTAYDSANRESDYSDEVAVVVNEPLSSTSPFDGVLEKLLAEIPAQPQNGPLMGWLLFSAAGLGASLVFGSPRKQR